EFDTIPEFCVVGEWLGCFDDVQTNRSAAHGTVMHTLCEEGVLLAVPRTTQNRWLWRQIDAEHATLSAVEECSGCIRNIRRSQRCGADPTATLCIPVARDAPCRSECDQRRGSVIANEVLARWSCNQERWFAIQ